MATTPLLTAGQMIQLSLAIRDYIEDQVNQGNGLVYLAIRTATSAEFNAALAPYINARLSGAQTAQANLLTAQSTQKSQTDTLVNDLQGLTTTLASL